MSLQLVQDLKSGETRLENLPAPVAGEGMVVIRTCRSLVSLGTEKMLVRFGQANLIQKARQQPERVREVLQKMKTDGIQPTLEAVFRKLDTPLPLGYSQSGVVIATGKSVTGISVGDRVASNGPHAEIISVPQNLVARIPDEVTYDQAAFTVVGAIALQGMRLARPEFGETVTVVGLGLIGLITGQLLKAAGCRVAGLDPDESKRKMAESFGIDTADPSAQDPTAFINRFTGGNGADAVIITASTSSNDVIKQAAHMSRKRGRIILVGVVGLQLDRADFYEKELTFQVSCSYGPGRYDDIYEQKGLDYPLPFVRWTENRNFQAILQALQDGSLNVDPLVTERIPLKDYRRIYDNMDESDAIATILEYPAGKADEAPSRSVPITTQATGKSATSEGKVIGKTAISDEKATGKPGTSEGKATGKTAISEGNLAVIGAGNFTRAMILPALKKTGAPIRHIVSSGGLSSTQLAQKYRIANSTTDYNIVLEDDLVDAVLITTRHNLHAPMVIDALKAGKHVFVEKPLALHHEELDAITEAVKESGKTLMTGFNRRFSPHIRKMKQLLGDKPGPVTINATMNAGFIPGDVWVHDPDIGGGRIIGEACHYIDLLCYLTGFLVSSVSMQALGTHPEKTTDNASIHLKFENGSLGVVNYFSNGNKSYSKERLEVYHQGKNLVLDNFRKLSGYGYRSGLTHTLLKTRQNKGHFEQFRLWHRSVMENTGPLIPYEEIENVTRASFAAIDSLQEQKPSAVTYKSKRKPTDEGNDQSR